VNRLKLFLDSKLKALLEVARMAKAWKCFWMLGFAALIPSVAASQDVVGKLQKSFLQPPPSARPHTWWHWVNDNVTKEGISADLEALAKAGVGGVQIFHVDVSVPSGPVKYHSPQWFALFRHAVQ
jgi:hypothetical protein